MPFSIFTFQPFKKSSHEQSKKFSTAIPLIQFPSSIWQSYIVVYLCTLNDFQLFPKQHYIPAVQALKFVFPMVDGSGESHDWNQVHIITLNTELFSPLHPSILMIPQVTSTHKFAETYMKVFSLSQT